MSGALSSEKCVPTVLVTYNLFSCTFRASFHCSVTFIFTTWYDQSTLRSIFSCKWIASWYPTSSLYFPTTSYNCNFLHNTDLSHHHFPFSQFSSPLVFCIVLPFNVLHLAVFHLSTHQNSLSFPFANVFWPKPYRFLTMGTSSRSIPYFPKRSTKRFPSSLFVFVIRSTGSSSSVLECSKSLTFLYAKVVSSIAKSCRSKCASSAPTKALEQNCLRLARFQSRECHCRLCTQKKRWWKSPEWQCQSDYSGWMALTRCNWRFAQDPRASMDCMLLLRAPHHASKRWGYWVGWDHEPQQTCNTFSALMRRDSTIADSLKALVNCAEAFKFEYKFKFVDVGTNDIVNCTLSSENLKTRTRATYVQYIRLSKLDIVSN